SLMTRHQLAAALYAPIRVVLYEDDVGHGVFEYDQPSTTFGQFGDERVSAVARGLDAALERALLGAAEETKPRGRRAIAIRTSRMQFIAEDTNATRVELEPRNLERFGAQANAVRAIYDLGKKPKAPTKRPKSPKPLVQEATMEKTPKAPIKRSLKQEQELEQE